MDPLDILPLEMWTEVFHWVKDAADWHNLYNTSPSFWNVFGTERVTALFPQVLPQLTNYLLEDDKDLKQLLPLRHVSHKWRHGVDLHVQGELKLSNPIDMKIAKLHYDFSPRKIESFLKRFENHGSNPFIGSTIHLRNDQVPFPWNIRLLQKFGAYLKQLEIFDFGQDFSILSRVGQLLQLVPALECLKIDCGGVEFRSLVVQRLSAESELPLLSKLKAILLITTNHAMTWTDQQEFQDSLIRNCCNPDSLTEATLECVPTELITFPNLKLVKLFGRSDPREGISRLLNASWQLNQLTMHSSRFENDIDMQLVFRAVEHFGETLHTLTLNMPFRNRDTEPLALPLLRYLRMTGGGSCVTCIDFLANLCKLEELHLEGWTERMYETRREGHIKVPFNGTHINMLTSNIWEVLPRLRKFYFGGGLQRRPTSSFERLEHIYSRGEGGQLHVKKLSKSVI